MVHSSPSHIRTIQPEDVKHAIDTKQNVILLDVRTPGEYSRGKLEGSINLPVDTISHQAESALPDKSARMYVYCLSGSRSALAVALMAKLGYSNVFDMPHGLLAWRAKGYPLVG